MTEFTPRTPHLREYVNEQGQHVSVFADDHGVVTISEESLDNFIRLSGFVETTTAETNQ